MCRYVEHFQHREPCSLARTAFTRVDSYSGHRSFFSAFFPSVACSKALWNVVMHGLQGAAGAKDAKYSARVRTYKTSPGSVLISTHVLYCHTWVAPLSCVQVLVFEQHLPSFFNHKKFLSFVRQLNFYGEPSSFTYTRLTRTFGLCFFPQQPWSTYKADEW